MKVWVWKDTFTWFISKKKPNLHNDSSNESYWMASNEQELDRTEIMGVFKRIKEEPQQYEVTASLVEGKGKK